jgi:hypothetical protein
MKNSDDAIEKVLKGLRDVDAPVGMERRILAAMEDRAEERVRSGRGYGRFAVAITCCVAVVAVMAVAVIVPVIRRNTPERGSSVVEKQVSPLRSAPVEMTTSKMGGDDGLRASGSVPWRVDGSAERLISHFPARVPEDGNGAVRVVQASTDTVDDGDALAMSETEAASFPAPPMPLTEQERLLLRLVHRGEPVELAMLDPKLEALRDAKFKQVFVDPKAESAAGSVAAAVAEGTNPPEGATEQAAPEKTAPMPSSPEQSAVKDGSRQQITIEEKQ